MKLLLLLIFMSACVNQENSTSDVKDGKNLVIAHGCMNCHEIPNLIGNPENVGPSLRDWKNQKYIVGNILNNQENLIKWIQTPHKIEKDTVMPDLKISEEDAKKIAAYLYSL